MRLTEIIKEAQKLINDLKQFPQYSQYIKEHQLKLIDDRLSVYDDLLNEGVIV